MLINKEEFNIRKRISISNEFDLVRIILAYCVVLQHSSTILDTPQILNIQSIPAVPIFLFISGFLVSESLLFSSSIFVYFQKRLKRILPGYIFVVFCGGTILFINNILFDTKNGQNLISLIKYFFYNLIFLNFKFPCLNNIKPNLEQINCAVNGSLWTIKFELIFYFLLPLIFFVLKRIRIRPFLFIFLNLLFLTLNKYISIYFLIFCCFITGASFYLISDNLEKIYKSIKIKSIIRSFLVFFVIILSGGILPLFIIFPMLLFCCFIPTENVNKDFKIFKYGDLSYGIYLLHYPIIKIIEPSLNYLKIPYYILPFLVIGLSSIGAFYLYWKLERKFLDKNSHSYKLLN